MYTVLRLHYLFLHMKDLREQIQFLKEQLKRRECEWWRAHSELQSRVDALTRENQTLMGQCVVQARPQSSGRSTPHPDARNLVSSLIQYTPASTLIQSEIGAGYESLSCLVFILESVFVSFCCDLWI